MCPLSYPGDLRDLPAVGGLHHSTARSASTSCGGDAGQGAGWPGTEHHGVGSRRSGEAKVKDSVQQP